MSRNEKLLNDLYQIVILNLQNEQFGVSDLARSIYLSRSQLHRKLKQLKGLSISQFIREIRLQEAVKLIEEDTATISEISYQVGFRSPSYFNKCFLDYFGFPPGEFQTVKNKYGRSEYLPTKSGNQYPTKKYLVRNLTKKRTLLIIGTLIFFSVFVFFVYNPLKTNSNKISNEKSIAVLPFLNLSSIENNSYFADGLLEDLLNRLATVEQFKVISRTSSDFYRERGKTTAPEIASKLGVSYLVEGSIQNFENSIKVTVQLIDAVNDDHLWIKTFERDFSDLFNLQSEIAFLIASSINTVLTDQQAAEIKKDNTVNIKAFELYQRGRLFWNKRSVDGLETSIEYFEKAIKEDPNYALAYANLADSYFLLYTTANKSKEYLVKAKKKALKALEIDNKLAEAYNVLGGIASFIEYDWELAEEYFLLGLKHNPNHSNLHHRYSEQLMYTGRYKEAKAYVNKAIALNPLSFIIRCVSAHQFRSTGEFSRALEDLEICYELVPDKYHFRIVDLSFELHCRLGNEKEILENSKNWGARYPKVKIAKTRWDEIYKSKGIEGIIQKRAELTMSPSERANLYMMIGAYDKSLSILENTVDGSARKLNTILSYYSFQQLSEEPRFKTVLKKMNLPWSPTTN